MGRTKGNRKQESNQLKRRLYDIYKMFGGRLTQIELARRLKVTRQYVSAVIIDIDRAQERLNATFVDVSGVMAELRKKGWKQKDLFVLLNEEVSLQTLSKWATGKSRARQYYARKLDNLSLRLSDVSKPHYTIEYPTDSQAKN